ncbi:MAG: hypothetical protein BBJ57_02490 [Desulfobacterales bacterium PC51MH44]|nr:MAG: hypothetical protein BBJ57_02490 [Desulfobacterales bacterium PC51MH44]
MEIGQTTPKQSTQPFGFNVIGYVSGNLGVGVTARNVINVLLEKGLRIAIYDIDPGLGRGKHDLSFDEYTVESVEELPYAINLFILPPATLSLVLLDYSPLVLRRDCLNVAFTMWELTVLPNTWKQALQFFDVLVAESDFIRYAFEFNLSKVLTVSACHPIYLPNNIRHSRESFGLPENKVIFVTSFEPHSDPQRKNPFAVIEAFQRALDDDSSAHLVIKMNNTLVDGKEHPIVQALRECCSDHSRIQLIAETLSYPEVLSLYASCDVFVSLHRSEGLGLGLMEAMALGKPVIATAWSGNMSYMDHTNSCLVGYQLISVEESIEAYKKELVGVNAVWANPDIEDAAAWMKKLANAPQLRASIGRKAAEDMVRFQEQAEGGHFIEELQTIWEHQAFLPRHSERRYHDLQKLRKAKHEHDLSQLSHTKRMEWKLRRFLDRYIFWRFCT